MLSTKACEKWHGSLVIFESSPLFLWYKKYETKCLSHSYLVSHAVMTIIYLVAVPYGMCITAVLFKLPYVSLIMSVRYHIHLADTNIEFVQFL